MQALGVLASIFVSFAAVVPIDLTVISRADGEMGNRAVCPLPVTI
jgi:hypothetical protein